MGTVLSFDSPFRSRPRETRAADGGACEIVIFPGVRIERHGDDLDLAHRITDAAGRGDFDGLGGSPRPRKTS
jgi:hypothetical protein